MSLFRTLVLSLCVASAAVATPALARKNDGPQATVAVPSSGTPRIAWLDRPRDQDRAFRATQEGRSMPLPQIERRVLPRMGGADYLGPEIRGPNVRMKFLDRGKVIWVDVDPRTGQIVDKSGD
ncbi:hypothetical protein [Sphingomonas sp.]|uniref:hypothetical protein n=1 Tax=Sphingomonas sp. TaxID=28214 RepID=UPI0025E4E7EC|nr:hypothetical protein [Sphingomonas sp.]